MARGIIYSIIAALRGFFQRIFFPMHSDYQTILNKYSDALTQPMTDLSRFARLAPYLLTKSMKLTGSSVMVLDRESHSYIVRAGEREANDIEGVAIAEDSPLISELLAKKKELNVEEVERQIKQTGRSSLAEKERLQKIKEEMGRLKAVLIIPSISEKEYFQKPTLLSTINLGAKLSGGSFSGEDINFLRTLANQAAISIEYAFIFEELKKNQQRVIQSEKLAAIGTTTAGIAHELKNPLTYISTVAQILPQKWDDAEFRKSVNDMLSSETQRMQLIVEGLLDYSRARELALKPTEIKDVIEKTIALLGYDARKKNIEIKTEYQHSSLVQADANRLIQVFMNIMANAIQAVGEGGGNLAVVTADEGKKIKVSIADTGPGIPRDQLDKIFDPFFSTKESGTGLGLMICKKIIEEHRGSVNVRSELGKGTTFVIRLPQAV